MLNLSRVSSVVAAALILVSQAKAEDAPADTVTFLSTCATNFEACRVEVVDVSNYNMVEMMGGTHGCTFPHPTGNSRVDAVPATNAIIDWLKANEAVRAPKTHDSITQAMEALWPNLCEH
jgi:hypothetical protein